MMLLLCILHVFQQVFLQISCRNCNGQAFKQTSVFRVSVLLITNSSAKNLFIFCSCTGEKGPKSRSRELITERTRRKVLKLEKQKHD